MQTLTPDFIDHLGFGRILIGHFERQPGRAYLYTPVSSCLALDSQMDIEAEAFIHLIEHPFLDHLEFLFDDLFESLFVFDLDDVLKGERPAFLVAGLHRYRNTIANGIDGLGGQLLELVSLGLVHGIG